ncbi:MAG: cupin domain-containing protein [Spirochaetota bacterium]
MKDQFTDKQHRKSNEIKPGILMTVMSYNDECMMCHFTMKKGGIIEPHAHDAVQNGYVISGKVRLFDANRETVFMASAGNGYVFDPQETHGLEVMEETELVESFAPLRPEFIPQ